MGENDIPKVKLGDSASVKVDAYGDRKFKGIVTQIASSNNGAATQTSLANTTTDVTNYKVYIRLLPGKLYRPGRQRKFPFRPGMSANADIQTKTHANVLSTPLNAVTTREIVDSTKTAKKKSSDDTEKTTPNEEDLETVVFVIDEKDNTLKKVKVKTSIQDINYIEITEGLKENELVVSGPFNVVSKRIERKRRKVVKQEELYEKKKE